LSSENLPTAQQSALAEIAEVEAQLGEKPLAVAATSGIKRSALATFLWSAPATLWLCVFLLAPVVMIVLVSLWHRSLNGFQAWDWTIENYRGIWDSSTYRTALLRTFQRAVFVCILCLAIGYPIAYFLSQIKSLRRQIALFILVLAPFWTAYLIRVIAWNPVLGQNGAINYLGSKLGFSPFDFLIYSDFAVNLTLVQLYVLFMVTPVFFQLAAIDNSAVEAAKDLGASPYKVFREVILPLSLPGVMIGLIFIFVLVMGDFATVRFIGGSTVTSVGNEVILYYNNVNLPSAAAGASILVVAMMAGVVILLKFAKIRESVSVVASAKERNRTADAIGKWLLAGVLALLAVYTLYASWKTLLELAIGIVLVGALLAGLYVVLGRKLQRSLGVFFGGFLLLMYGPTIVMTLLSFQDSRGLTSFPASGVFSSYWYDILVNDSTQQALRDSIVVSLKLSALVCVITAVLSLMLGMAFRERFRGSTPLFYLVLLSLMTPGLLLSLGSTLLTSYIGRDASIYTTALGVQVVWALPFGFLVMLTVFNRYDARAEEAARDLGASAIRTFREVTLPIVWVGVFGAALFGFTLAWNEFERTYLVTGPVATLPVQLYTVMTATVFQPYIFALGVLTTLFAFVLIALFLIVSGVAVRRARAKAVEEDNAETFSMSGTAAAPGQAPAPSGD
jgi:ABC-type spermidine/putrescine transport system permease subunit I